MQIADTHAHPSPVSLTAKDVGPLGTVPPPLPQPSQVSRWTRQREGRGTVFAFAALCLVGLGLSVGSGFRPSSLPGLFWRNWETASLQVILGTEDLFDCIERESAKGHRGELSMTVLVVETVSD